MNYASPALHIPRASLRTTATTFTAAARLSALIMLALIAYYFLGYDQGAVSVFGSDTHIHEFLHDARHLLGFPCH